MAWRGRPRREGRGLRGKQKAWAYAKNNIAPDSRVNGRQSNNNINGTTYRGVNRVTDGLVCNWWFDEGSGNIIYDRTPITFATDLNWIYNPNAGLNGEWSQDSTNSDRWYLNLSAGGACRNTYAPSEITTQLMSTNELTVEMWVKPSDAEGLATNGPGRLLSHANPNNPYNDQCFMLGHGTWTNNSYNAKNFSGRVKVKGSVISLWSGDDTATSGLHHLALTCRPLPQNDVEVKFYLDGVEVDSFIGAVSDDQLFSEFSTDSTITVGAELDGNKKAPGGYYLGAVYKRALSAQEVQTNFNEGVVPISTGYSVPQIVTLQVPSELAAGETTTAIVGLGGTRNGNITLNLGMSAAGKVYGTDFSLSPTSVTIPKNQSTATVEVSCGPEILTDFAALVYVESSNGGAILTQPGQNIEEKTINLVSTSIKPEVGFDYNSNPQAYPAGGLQDRDIFSVKTSRVFSAGVDVRVSGSADINNTANYFFLSGGSPVALSDGINFVLPANQQVDQIPIHCSADTSPEDPIYADARLPGRIGLWYYAPGNRWWISSDGANTDDSMNSKLLLQNIGVDMLLRTTNTDSLNPDNPHSQGEIQGYFDDGFTFLGVKGSDDEFGPSFASNGKRVNDDWPIPYNFTDSDGNTGPLEYWMLGHESELFTPADWYTYSGLEYNPANSYNIGDQVWVDDTPYNSGSGRTRYVVFEATTSIPPGQSPQFAIGDPLSTPLETNGWKQALWAGSDPMYVKKGSDRTVDEMRASAQLFKANNPSSKLYYFFGKGVCVAGFNGNGKNTRPGVTLNDGTVLTDQLSWFSAVAGIPEFDGFLFDYYPYGTKPQGAVTASSVDPPELMTHPILGTTVIKDDPKWVVSGVHRIKEWSKSVDFPNGKPVYPTLAATPNFVSAVNTNALAAGLDYTLGGDLAAYHNDTPTYQENFGIATSCLDAGADGIIWYTHTWKSDVNDGATFIRKGNTYAGPEASFWPICHNVWRSSTGNNDYLTDPFTGQPVNLHQLIFPNHPGVAVSGDGTLENMWAITNYVKNYFAGNSGSQTFFPDGDSFSAVMLSASVSGGSYAGDALTVCSTLSDAGAYFVQAALPPLTGTYNQAGPVQVTTMVGPETSATTGPRISTTLHPYHNTVWFVDPGEGNGTNKIEVPSGGLVISGYDFTNVKLNTTNELRFVDCNFSGQQDFHNGINQWYVVQEVAGYTGRNEKVDFEYCHFTGAKNTVYSTLRSMYKCSFYHVLSDHLRLKDSSTGYLISNCWFGGYTDAEDSILNNFSGMYDTNSGVGADPEQVQATNGDVTELVFRKCNFQGRDSFWSDGTHRDDQHRGTSLLAGFLMKDSNFNNLIFDDCTFYGGGNWCLQINCNNLPPTATPTIIMTNCKIGTSVKSGVLNIQDSQGLVTKVISDNKWLDTLTEKCRIPSEAIAQGVTTNNGGQILDVNDMLKGLDGVSFAGPGMNRLGNSPWGQRSTPA